MRPRGQGFFRSDDGGETWRRLSDDSPSEIVQIPGDRCLVGIFGHERIRMSEDGGETWSAFDEGLYLNVGGPKEAWSGGNYYALGAGCDFWLVGDGNGTSYRRGRNDAAWTRLASGRYHAGDPDREPFLAKVLPEQRRMTALMTLAVDPNDGRHWFAADWFELRETRDAGENWTSRVKNIMQLVSYDVCFDPVDARGLPPLVPGKSAASALVEDERDGSILLAVSGAVGEGAGGVYRSRDVGLTWTWEGEGLASGESFDYGINHSQGAWPRLVRSPDGGLLTGGKTGRWLLVRGADANGWRKASMWAPTWKRYPIAADPFVAGRFFRGGEDGTYETTDAGVSWHAFAPLAGKVCRAFAFDRHHRGLVAFGCKDGIFVSYDGGATLRRLKAGLDAPTGMSRNIVLDRDRLFILTSGGGVYRFKTNLIPTDYTAK